LYTSNFLTQSSPRAAFGNPHPEYPHVPFFNLSRVLTPSCLSSVHYPILPIFLSTVPTHPISYASTSQNQNSNKNTKHHAECTHPSQPASPQCAIHPPEYPQIIPILLISRSTLSLLSLSPRTCISNSSCSCSCRISSIRRFSVFQNHSASRSPKASKS
jgi:hypothetical protein